MFDGHYLEWNNRRIKMIIDHYGHQFFARKKLLDLGCGHADISGVLYRLGGDVTAVDGRQEHLKIVEKKYNGIKIVKADLDRGWPFFGRTFDLTLDLALLSFLNNYEEHLKAVIASTEYLVLETAVSNSNDPNWCVVKGDAKSNYDESINGVQSQVSAAAIERVLSDCGMTFKRVDKTRLNCGNYRYDWLCTNDGTFDPNLRRLWFCQKNTNGPIAFSFHNSITTNLQNSNIPVAAPAPPIPIPISVAAPAAAPPINVLPALPPAPMMTAATSQPYLLYLPFGAQTEMCDAFRSMGIKLMVFNYWNMWQQCKNDNKVREEFIFFINQFHPQFVHIDIQSSNMLNDQALNAAQQLVPGAVFTKCNDQIKQKAIQMSKVCHNITSEQLKGLLSST